MRKGIEMKIAILCETSGTIRELMREKGHDVISCDILPADDLSPSDGHHWQGDAMKFLEDSDDGEFDILIAHPPCTALAVSGIGGTAKEWKSTQSDWRPCNGLWIYGI